MTEMKRPEEAAQRFQAAWNAHDMTVLGSLFHQDAALVNRFGHYVSGVEGIIALHTPIHETIYGDSSLDNEVDPGRTLRGVARRPQYQQPGGCRALPLS